MAVLTAELSVFETSQPSNFRNRAIVERADVHYRPIVTVTPVTHKSQTLAPASLPGLSLLAVVGGAEAQAIFFRRRH